ncbi:putative endonuclease [Natronobacillus azotifigens]|uniref:GIY-YIG nuclease family protein n=1 Tax=Natronobacillus azotifigens TaxID=472978 RepID=UPI002342F074|nr:GIY-YIG nuclease family protein [Natronobacillus azotifigens]
MFIERNKKHITYILECRDGSLYTGYTNNLMRRLKMHENGKGAKYTRGRGPFQLKFWLSFETKREAMQKEYQIKQMTKQEKQLLIEKYQKGLVIDEDTEKL